MALYAIGDLHLSLGSDKPMDVFGGAWNGYLDKLRKGLSVIGEDDTTVLMGDVSWAMDFPAAVPDFQFISDIPGKKIILKGNHDYWWNTVAKFDRFCGENAFPDLHLLHNNCFFYEDCAICGTRGWFFEEDKKGTHDEKVFRRELMRLEVSLQAAGDKAKLCFLHYPPIYQGYRCPEIIALLQRYDVKACYYGHLHGGSHRLAVEGLHGGVHYQLASADYVNFNPVKILPVAKN
ncbi:MAG: metallophosphoesterase [Oscillospiraceae bacterium]|nr:metallophosphoesterase [Oscillospiraceae bacterium]